MTQDKQCIGVLEQAKWIKNKLLTTGRISSSLNNCIISIQSFFTKHYNIKDLFATSDYMAKDNLNLTRKKSQKLSDT